MARVLVIGGTLFIGRTLVERLLERGDDVAIMHRGRGSPFGERVEEIRCDRTDPAAVGRALAGTHFDVVYDNVYDWERGTSGDQVSAAAIAADARGRYVFTSTIAVYPPGGEFAEDAELVPSDAPNVYGAQKADSERALFTLGRERGIPVTTLRPAFIYGPYNPFEREAFFWDRLRAGRPIIIPGDGLTTMQWVYSQDVVAAAMLAAESESAIGRAYNLANWPPVTQLDFVRLLARIAGAEADLVHVPRERVHQLGGSVFQPPYYFGAYLDIPPITVRADRVREELGLALTPLEDGLRQTYRWYERQERPKPDYSWEDQALRSGSRVGS